MNITTNMNITTKQLARFVALTKLAVYDQTGSGESGLGLYKQEYRNLGRRILKYIAEQMQLPKGSYEIRWNPGGVACSGDHTLHTDHVYVALHDNIGSGWFYYRTCKGRKDYAGGQNQIVSWSRFTAPGGLDKLIAALKTIQAQGYYTSDGDFNMNVPMVEAHARALINS
jgi:hypothetical protein